MDLKAVVTPHHRSTWFGSNSLAVCLAVIRKKLTQRGLALVARRAKTGLVCRSKRFLQSRAKNHIWFGTKRSHVRIMSPRLFAFFAGNT